MDCLNNLPCGKRIVNLFKNGKDIIQLKIFNGYIEKNKKQVTQYLHFRCGMTHSNYSLKKSRKDFYLTKRIFKN